MTLVEFLRARLDEDEQWALACNRPYAFAAEGSKAPGRTLLDHHRPNTSTPPPQSPPAPARTHTPTTHQQT